MNIKELTQEAMKISELYDNHNIETTGKTWSRLEIVQGFAGERWPTTKNSHGESWAEKHGKR